MAVLEVCALTAPDSNRGSEFNLRSDARAAAMITIIIVHNKVINAIRLPSNLRETDEHRRRHLISAVIEIV